MKNDLTDVQLQTILAMNDRAIANGEVYSHAEVMKQIKTELNKISQYNTNSKKRK